MDLASFPSPETSVWHIGPVPLRAYALCILAGVVLAVYLTERRLRARGGPPGAVLDIAVYAVPAGIVGARLYHVFTSPDRYFGADGSLVNIVKLWEGGLGIWGAVAGGALGAWFACRQLGIPLRILGDALAPGLAVAQAVGRFGNWFNQELYGRPTDLPWALEIDVEHRVAPYFDDATFHPTFLYEALWCLGAAAVIWYVGRRFHIGRGRLFALYVMLYAVGRAWIEYLRVDDAHHILGLRLNDWTCLIVFLGALAYFLLRKGPQERLLTSEDGSVRVVVDSTEAEDESPSDSDGEATSTETDEKPPNTTAGAKAVDDPPKVQSEGTRSSNPSDA